MEVTQLLVTSMSDNDTNAGCNHEDWPTATTIFIAIYYCIICLVSVTSNIVNLIALPHAKTELGVNTVLLFRALAVVDLLTGIVGSGGKFLQNALGPCNMNNLRIYNITRKILNVALLNYSMLILGCVSVHRFLVIKRPLTHKSLLTHRNTTYMLAFVAIVGALEAILAYLLSYFVIGVDCYFQARYCPGTPHAFLVVYLFIPVCTTVIITVTNLKLVPIIQNHKHRIRRQSVSEDFEVRTSPRPPQRKQHHGGRCKGVRTLILVIVTFYICCAPALIYDSYVIATEDVDSLPEEVDSFFTALLMTNSCLNSIIYLFTMRSFRQVIKRSMTDCSPFKKCAKIQRRSEN